MHTSPPIKLLYIVANLELGGAERLVANWCEALNGAGFECYILCIIEKSGPYVAELEVLGIKILELPQLEWNTFQFMHRLSEIVRMLRIDVVHSQCAWSLPQQALASRLGGAKGFVLTVHNTYTHGTFLQSFRRKILLRCIQPFLDKIIGVSDAVTDHTRDWLGIKSALIITIHNGIFCERFDLPDIQNKEAARRKLGIPESGPLAITVAALSEQKDHLTLLKSASILHQRIPALKFILVGDGDLKSELKKYCSDNELEKIVFFLGKRTDVPQLLQVSDLFVLSSKWEGLGLVFAEAQAAGLPVVGTRVTGIPEVVQDGRTGLLVPVGDAQKLAESIEELIVHSQKAIQMGNAGKKFVFKHFSMEKCIQQYKKLYQSIG